MVNVVVDFEYGYPIIMVAHLGDKLFMKSEVKVSIPPRPYFNLSSNYSCTEKQLARWKDRVYNNIYEAVCKSFKESLYGEVFLTVNGLVGVENGK